MNTYWLHKNNKQSLIVFFAGWGQDEHTFKGIASENYDVLIIYNYIDINTLNIPNEYNIIITISWSLGVWVSQHFFNEIIINSKFSIAINGTLFPIDNQYGIPEETYQGTINGFSERSRDKFFFRMCGNKQTLQQYTPPLRDINSQLAELTAIQKHYVNSELITTSLFSHIIIGENDRIFPPNHQHNAWALLPDQGKITTLSSSHYPFDQWNSWDELITKTVQ